MDFDLQFTFMGSTAQLYRVRVGIAQGKAIADCTCPFGRTLKGRLALCKHRRAILRADATALDLKPADLRKLKSWLASNHAAVELLLTDAPVSAPGRLPAPEVNAKSRSFGLAACIDIETTGLSAHKDALTEIAVALFRYDEDSAEILGIVDLYASVEQPAVPIPPGIARKTSITGELTQGRAIDWDCVRRLIEQAEFLVAHNAEFERRFLSRIPRLVDGKRLLCTQRLPRWYSGGERASLRLENLTAQNGVAHIAHRAFGDVIATVQLLGRKSKATGEPYFADMLRFARQGSAANLVASTVS